MLHERGAVEGYFNQDPESCAEKFNLSRKAYEHTSGTCDEIRPHSFLSYLVGRAIIGPPFIGTQ